MTVLPRLAWLVLVGIAAVVAVAWLLSHVMPHPYPGYLAVAIVGLVATEIYKRQPRQRARRLFRIYLLARDRGLDPAAARDRILRALYRSGRERQAMASRLEAAWQGPTDKDQVMAGVGAMLRDRGVVLDAEQLSTAHDRERDRLKVTGWPSLPAPFVEELWGRLEERERAELDTLAGKYRLFDQNFFRRPSSLGVDVRASVVDFARLLLSMGNRLRRTEPGDAERAYRLSLRLRPEGNLAHAGLALLLVERGRTGEAAREAQAGLAVLDAYARRAGDAPPTPEDIAPFASPDRLREALHRTLGDASA